MPIVERDFFFFLDSCYSIELPTRNNLGKIYDSGLIMNMWLTKLRKLWVTFYEQWFCSIAVLSRRGDELKTR